MTEDKEETDKGVELRRRAELRLSKRRPRAMPSDADLPRLVHELEVHKIELEMQNEALREARLALEESLARQVDLYDFAPVAYFTLGSGGRIREANLIGADILGNPRAGLIGRRLGLFLTPATRTAFNAALDKVLNTDSAQEVCEVDVDRAGVDHCHLRLDLLYQDNDECRATALDITRVKQAENDLRASEERLRELIDQASDGIFIADLDGRYTDVNIAGCAMLGYAREEILGKTIVDLIPAEDVDRLWQARDRLLKGGVNVAEWSIRKKDGTLLPIEVSAKILADGRWLGFVRDITERRQRTEREAEHAAALEREVRQRKQAEAALRQEHNFVETILNTQAALVVAADTGRRLQVFNRACEAVTGYTSSEIRNDPDWFERLIPSEEQEAVKAVLEALLDGCPSVVHQNHFRHRDGSLRLIRWIGTFTKDSAGRVQYIIGTGIDITEQAKAEEEARSHLEEASRLQRLQTANELATMLAHEINQPLASITTLAEVLQQMLQRPQPDRDKLMNNLDTISREALRAGEIIRHLRGFVGRGRIEPAPMEVNAVVRSAAAMLAPKARASGIGLELDLTETPLPVMGVPVQIEQVLLNLVLNAIDAIRDTGEAQGRITVETKRVEDMAQVSVRDTGPGIKDAERLFEPLVTTKDYGLGVGLRISRSLVEAHGGRLWAEPRVPGGIFHFVLPLAPH